VTSDYLKQLQLTKQLEQKAKEAAQHRKAAEEKLAEAERSLALASTMGIETTGAQKLLTEGQAAYGKREYSTALANGSKVLNDLSLRQGEKVGEVLESALGALGMITEAGKDRQAVEKLVDRAKRFLAEARPGEAMEEARKAREAAEQYADQRMSAMFSQAQNLIDLAEEKKLAVSAKKQTLAKAIKLHEEGDREASLAKLGSCFKGLQDSFSKILEERATALMGMAEEAAGAGGDVSAVASHVAKAREALAQGRIKESFETLARAEEAVVPLLTRAVELKLAAQEGRSNWLRDQGINIGRYITASRKAGDTAASGNGEDSLEWLRRAEKALRDSEAELVMEHIEKLRPRLMLGKKINADIDNVVSKLEEARTAMVYGRCQEALELVSEASAELNDSLAEYQVLGEELKLTRSVFLQARRMKLSSREASEIVARSRLSALGGKLRESVEGLSAARALMLGKVRDILALDLLNGELLVTAGWSVGADVDEDAEELEALTDELTKGSVDNIGQRIAAINQSLEAYIKEASGELMEEAERMTCPSFKLDELAPLRKRYGAARGLFEQDQWYRAGILAREVIADAERAQRASLDTLTILASSLLELGRQLGIESQTLNQKMADVKGGGEHFAESLRSLNDVILYARSLIKDELTRSLSQLMRSSGAARKNGMVTAHIDRIIEEASGALAATNMEGGFNLVREAERELEKTTAIHSEIYDLIVLLSRFTAELKLPPESRVPQLLQETKVLFEAGRYDGARTSARNCYQEAEAVGAELLAPRKVQEALELVPVVQQLGLGTDRVTEAVDQAQALIRQGQFPAALAMAKDARKRMVDIVTEKIQAEIAEVRTMMVQGGADTNESSALTIVEKAESLLIDRRYEDALRAIRFGRNEASQLLSLSASVGEELARVEDALREIESLGIETRDAREIFDQATRYRSIKRHNLVVEMTRRALHGARTTAAERMSADLTEIEAELGITDLKGEDLTLVQHERKEAFARKMEQHRYTEAREALSAYWAGLNALIEVRDQCASSLGMLAQELVRVPSGSRAREETERLMTAAQKAYQEGAFRECLGLTEECRASGAAALLWHDRCSRRLNEMNERLLVGDGRRSLDPEIAALMEEARTALAQGRYEAMDRALLKGSRLHARARGTSVRRGLADLINLVRLFPSAGLRLNDLPPEAATLLDLPMAEPGDVRDLSETVGAVHGVVIKGISARLASVRERAIRSPADSSISLALLSVAERSLAEESLEQALELIGDADRAVGASKAEVQEMRALAHRYQELAAIADGLGLDGSHHRDPYRQALRSRDVPSSVHRLKEAVHAADRSTAAYLPLLEVRSSEVFNRGSSPALQLKLEGGPPGPVLWPQRKVTLPIDPNGKGGVSLSYRALFLQKPFVTVLGPSA
jgi:hypothetical protein